jgi:hypothetical protein
MAETSTIFGFMKYVSATDILSDFKKTVDSHFVNSLKGVITPSFFICNIHNHFLDPVQLFRLIHLHQEGLKIPDQCLDTIY